MPRITRENTGFRTWGPGSRSFDLRFGRGHQALGGAGVRPGPGPRRIVRSRSERSTGTMAEFAERMIARARAVPANTNEGMKAAATAALDTVVRRTPVDTGRARSNWIVSLGGPSGAERPPFAPGRFLGVSETANAEAAIADGVPVIDSRQPGQDIYIQNNIPYILRLNRGGSKQAPAMFVQMAVRAAISTVRGFRFTVRTRVSGR